MKNTYIKIFALFFVIFSLTSCRLFFRESEEFSPTGKEHQSEKVVELQGVVKPKELSIFSEGTHFLLIEGETPGYILKSKIVNLSNYEDMEVKIKGNLIDSKTSEQDKIIDVLMIEKVAKEQDDESKEDKEYELKKAQMQITLPYEWSMNESGGFYRFRYNGNREVSISIESFLMTSESGERFQEDQQKATEISIQGQKAFRILKGDNVQIFVPIDKKIVLIEFDPQENESEEKTDFLNALSTIKWTSEALSLRDLESCGGEDKKLCEVGYRCELQGTDLNAKGYCVKIGEESSYEELIKAQKDLQEKTQKMSEEIMRKDDNAQDEESVEEFSKIEQRDIKDPFDEYTEVQNRYFDFKFDYPRNYFWRHFGAVNGYKSLTGISDQEMDTADDAFITIGIVDDEVSKTTKGYKRTVELEEVLFEVDGISDLKDDINKIADSIKTF
ncbi:MAG: hypothetical protein N4A36_04075 [Candidatus Gracilibacteria bacterium]|jgi:hypothetical protein|nr:hypothetical protein [Candidatus Gracilibacteria bacterium]